MVSLLDDPRRVLRRCLLPATLLQARDYLSRRLETASLLSICQRHFPGEFRQKVLLEQAHILPLDAPYSPGENACLDLLERLFPLAREYVQMCADEGERPVNIPLYSFGIDLWNLSYERDRQCWPGWLMLALLNRSFSLEQYQQLGEGSLDRSALAALEGVLLYTPGTWSYETLQQVCASAPEPLCWLATACQMLDHATGNLFLDPGEEESVDDAHWCEEDLELLAREWKEAQVMLDKASALTEWLTTHPGAFRKVVDLWNLSLWTMGMQPHSRENSAANA